MEFRMGEIDNEWRKDRMENELMRRNKGDEVEVEEVVGRSHLISCILITW